MSRFSTFGELSRFMYDRGLTSRGNPVQERLLSVRPLKIPLESTHGKRVVRAISVRANVKGMKLLSNLLWHAIFGSKFKIIHWQFLFDLVDRTNQWDEVIQSIFDILMITNCTAKAGNLDLFLKNLRSVNRSLSDRTQVEKLLMRLNNSGIVIPRKAIPIEELLIINFNDKIVQKLPLEPSRIGVGYKDKGTLPLPGTEYDPDEISPFEEGASDNLFIKLLNVYRGRKYSFKV